MENLGRDNQGTKIIDMDDVEDEETRRLMKDHEIDQDTAEKAQELIDSGLDEDEAVEIAGEI